MSSITETGPQASPSLILKPSELASLTEDELGVSLGNIRRELRTAKGDDVDSLRDCRDQITERLDAFVIMNLGAIDRDPQIKALVGRLSDLTLATKKAAAEMRGAKKAIDRATKIIGFADDFIGIVGKVAGVIS
jgi:hypothetical protein